MTALPSYKHIISNRIVVRSLIKVDASLRFRSEKILSANFNFRIKVMCGKVFVGKRPPPTTTNCLYYERIIFNLKKERVELPDVAELRCAAELS